MLKEFKEFAMKGNLVDMAVGFVMGGAFATVVTAFIQGVFLPLLAPIMGGIDLSAIAYTVSPAEQHAEEGRGSCPGCAAAPGSASGRNSQPAGQAKLGVASTYS